MEYFIIENGKVKERTKEEFKSLKGTNVNEFIKNMSLEELKAFEKERYEKFIKPLMEHNISELKKKYN